MLKMSREQHSLISKFLDFTAFTKNFDFEEIPKTKNTKQ